MDNKEIVSSYSFSSQTFNKLSKFSWWVQNAPQSNSLSFLAKLDYLAGESECDVKNVIELEKKVDSISRSKRDWKGISLKIMNDKELEIERKVFSLFTEIMTYGFLIENSFKSICFVKECSSKPTPDFFAEKDFKPYYIEVKNMETSKEESLKLQRDGKMFGDVNMNFKEALQNKIDYFVDSSSNKFKSIENSETLDSFQKILILNYSTGIDARLSVNFEANLLAIFGIDYFTEIGNKNKMTIITKRFF